MTGGPSAGPASAYEMFRTPASICFSGPNDVWAPGLIAGSFFGGLCVGLADHAELSGRGGEGSGANEVAAAAVDIFGRFDRVHFLGLRVR